MQTPIHNTYFNDLQEEYFDNLDHQGIDYLDVTEGDQGHKFYNVKVKYLLSADEMAKELGFNSFLEYAESRHIEIKSDNDTTTVQRQFGRFIVSYDGKDMFINDAQDDQHVVFSSDLSPELIETMCTALIETIKTYNKVKGAL